MPVMIMARNSLYIALCKALGMCLSKMPGMLPGPGALGLGSRRRATWKIADVMLPINMFF